LYWSIVFVPLALVLLGPVIVNILLYHLFLSRPGIVMGILVAILWLSFFTVIGSTSREYVCSERERWTT
jgi:hypothetical protein